MTEFLEGFTSVMEMFLRPKILGALFGSMLIVGIGIVGFATGSLLFRIVERKWLSK